MGYGLISLGHKWTGAELGFEHVILKTDVCFLSMLSSHSVTILVTILYWLNTLSITSEAPKHVRDALRKEIFSTSPLINLIEN